MIGSNTYNSTKNNNCDYPTNNHKLKINKQKYCHLCYHIFFPYIKVS